MRFEPRQWLTPSSSCVGIREKAGVNFALVSFNSLSFFEGEEVGEADRRSLVQGGLS